MESTRQAKIARLLQKELSEIFRQQTAKTHGVIVSVSAVRVSPDLSVAKVYLSIFPSPKGAEMLESSSRPARCATSWRSGFASSSGRRPNCSSTSTIRWTIWKTSTIFSKNPEREPPESS